MSIGPWSTLDHFTGPCVVSLSSEVACPLPLQPLDFAFQKKNPLLTSTLKTINFHTNKNIYTTFSGDILSSYLPQAVNSTSKAVSVKLKVNIKIILLPANSFMVFSSPPRSFGKCFLGICSCNDSQLLCTISLLASFAEKACLNTTRMVSKNLESLTRCTFFILCPRASCKEN